MSLLPPLLAQRQGHRLPAADHGLQALTARLPPQAEAVLASLLGHRSVRHYRADPLPEGTLDLLVAAAQSAPTSSNLQAWSLVVVQQPETRAQLAEWAGGQAHIRQAPLFLVWLADLSRLDRVADRRGEAADANAYLEQWLVASIDAALAAQNMVVAAEALGLGTVYIGALRNRADAVARTLGLPPRAFPLFGLCVGQPDPQRPGAVKPRLGSAAVVHQERYDSQPEAAVVADYDAVLQDFQQAQGLQAQPWSQQASARVRGPDSLMGRDALVRHLHEQGFGLR